MERDDYGKRPDGSHTLWAARLVAGPVNLVNGRFAHRRQIVSKTAFTRTGAIGAGFTLIAEHRDEWCSGARLIIGPSFFSRELMPGAKDVCYGPEDVVNGVLVDPVSASGWSRRG